MYREEEYLMLSGIQHFLFCRRQWALIHIEQIWSENRATSEGQLIHAKVDKPFIKEKRKDVIISRAMDVSSKRLGLSGRLDVIEFIRSEGGISLKNRKGLWTPVVVEYKRGKKKRGEYDRVQLMAQALCVEEVFDIRMDYGYMYYHQTDSRERVEYTKDLRALAIETADAMHDYYKRRYIPKAEYFKNCTQCSLYEDCRPRLTKKARNVERYIYGAEL
ncbi:MAG: CRISPR-associated protein Cas4 [Firmicutes bacterium]|nr:CRISPR-associated protein Cas4 [Bacillota bacterium]